jgi:hypothetical protein
MKQKMAGVNTPIEARLLGPESEEKMQLSLIPGVGIVWGSRLGSHGRLGALIPSYPLKTSHLYNWLSGSSSAVSGTHSHVSFTLSVFLGTMVMRFRILMPLFSFQVNLQWVLVPLVCWVSLGLLVLGQVCPWSICMHPPSLGGHIFGFHCCHYGLWPTEKW